MGMEKTMEETLEKALMGKTSTEVAAEEMAGEMGSMVHSLFSLPVEMRERAVDALGELVGVSRAQACAKAEAQREEERADERELLSMKITAYSQLVQGFLEYLQRPVDARYPPPPEAPRPVAHPPQPGLDHSLFHDMLHALSAEQRRAVWALLHEDQRALVRQFIPDIDALVA